MQDFTTSVALINPHLSCECAKKDNKIDALKKIAREILTHLSYLLSPLSFKLLLYKSKRPQYTVKWHSIKNKNRFKRASEILLLFLSTAVKIVVVKNLSIANSA